MANKAVVLKMKVETAGDPILEFIGLRPKMYSFEGVHINADGSRERFEKHRAKGIQRAAAENIYHKKYLLQLKSPTENYALNRRLGPRLHLIYAIEVTSLHILHRPSHHPISITTLPPSPAPIRIRRCISLSTPLHVNNKTSIQWSVP